MNGSAPRPKEQAIIVLVTVSQDPNPPAADHTLTGLVDKIGWYDEHARSNRVAYQGLRIVVIVLGAAIPVLTTSGAPRLAVAVVGGAIVVVEGVQQVFRFQERYISYRSTWNALDREQRLFKSRAGRYANNPNPEQSLAEREDQILAEENSRWSADMRTTTAPQN